MSDTVYGAAARAAALAAGDPDWMHVTKWPISRAVSGKYLLYEGKVMELKEFFSRAVSYARENGENVSADEIQQKIRLIVEKEDKKNPLSDQKIVDKMKEEGLKVSRRTLAKYRERLGIPASSFRKRH